MLHNHVQSYSLVEQNGSSFMLSFTMWCGGGGHPLTLCPLLLAPRLSHCHNDFKLRTRTKPRPNHIWSLQLCYLAAALTSRRTSTTGGMIVEEAAVGKESRGNIKRNMENMEMPMPLCGWRSTFL